MTNIRFVAGAALLAAASVTAQAGLIENPFDGSSVPLSFDSGNGFEPLADAFEVSYPSSRLDSLTVWVSESSTLANFSYGLASSYTLWIGNPIDGFSLSTTASSVMGSNGVYAVTFTPGFGLLGAGFVAFGVAGTGGEALSLFGDDTLTGASADGDFYVFDTGTGAISFAGNVATGYDIDFRASVSAVPEPSTYAAFGAAGLMGLIAFRRFRRAKKA